MDTHTFIMLPHFASSRNALHAAQDAYHEASVGKAKAERHLNDAQMDTILDDPAYKDCRNDPERKAYLRRKHHDLYGKLEGAEDALSQARCNLNKAETDWQAERYNLMQLEIETRVGGM